VKGPVPRRASPVLLLVSSRRTPASPQSEKVRRAKTIATRATSVTTSYFRAAVIPLPSSSHICQAPRLLPPLYLYSALLDLPVRNTSHRTAGPFTPRNGRVVTLHELWYRYIPESSNWYGGICTRWIEALSAATSDQFELTTV